MAREAGKIELPGGSLAHRLLDGLRAEGVDVPAALFTERDAAAMTAQGITKEVIAAEVEITKAQALEAINAELVRRLRVELDEDPEGIGYAGMAPAEIVDHLNRPHPDTITRNGRARTFERPAPIGHVWEGLPYAPAAATTDDVAAALAFKGDTTRAAPVKLPPSDAVPAEVAAGVVAGRPGRAG